MRVTDIPTAKSSSISLEMFPPKNPDNLHKFLGVANNLTGLSPDFISVTYGAGGGTKSTTLSLAKEINKIVPVVAHLNCDGLTGPLFQDYINQLQSIGVENILALRGDKFDSDHFSGSLDLIRRINRKSNLCIGAACYPEGHPDSRGRQSDLHFCYEKVLAGCNFFVTQMCFNNDKLADFLEELCMVIGFQIPIRIGLMPILKKQTLLKCRELSVSVPGEFQPLLDNDKSDEFFRELGMEYCANQINELLSWGYRNIHLYTMNDYEATKEILNNTNVNK